MGDGRIPPERGKYGFEVAERTPIEVDPDEERPRFRGLRPIRSAAATAGHLAVYAAVAAVAVGAWSFFPEAEPLPTPKRQILPQHPKPVMDAEPETISEDGAGTRDTKSRAIGRARGDGAKGKTNHVTFSLGGSSSSGSPASSSPTISPASETDVKHEPKRKKKAAPPKPPVPTLEFRRVVKDKSGNHYHNTDDAAIEDRLERGFVLRETVGYLFDSQIEGTRMLAIDEGVMGWIYEADQGRRTVPLYRLTGPDYHDYEAIFTSSEKVRTKWEGEGWRVTRIEGYIVRSP